jgi:hypothetical protein
MFFKILKKFCNDKTLLTYLVKKIISKLFFLKAKILVNLNATDRPNYSYCVYHAAILAKKLGHKSFSVIEFGVAGGNGILFLEKFCQKIKSELNIDIQIYGFDLKNGLMKSKDYKDLPYWFKEGFYSMDETKLKNLLKNSQLILGDVKETVKNFFHQYNPAPIGVILNDLDYYSSTINSFDIFNAEDSNYLPRVFCYFDDIIGNENEMYNPYSGELLAIEEFNKKFENKKITLNQNLVATSNESWRYQIYYFHNFTHPEYNIYIGEEEQINVQKALILKK